MSKETYYSVKRDLLECQKRPTIVSKETYSRVGPVSAARRSAPGMSYEEEDTSNEEDTCMSYEEEDTCMSLQDASGPTRAQVGWGKS
jgi:hypothetical protein